MVDIPIIWWLTPISAFIALLFAYIFYKGVMDKDEGTPRMREIAQAVRDGAMAYLRRQYRDVEIAFVVLFIIFIIIANKINVN